MPGVSIILPTYNRASFLPQALESILGQRYQDWELIIVDDGSTDETREVVSELIRGLPQPIQHVHQENRGAYAARNAGLDLARGEHVAFFDSDDLWLPHHLESCVAGLEANPTVDWIYGACQVVDYESGRVLAPNSFYLGDRPRTFLRLRSRVSGSLRIIDDPSTLRCMLLSGLYCGLQCSVIRRRVFDGRRFWTRPRNEAEDQVFVVRVLAEGCRFAYLNDVLVLYRVHAQNSSAAGSAADLHRRLRVVRELIAGYETLRGCIPLGWAETRALERRLARDYFWLLGYHLWQHASDRGEALVPFRRALRLCPWNVFFWKTYLLALLRLAVTRRGPRREGVAEC
jgi:glycosyltransferase involved in cell wall biosynthesis